MTHTRFGMYALRLVRMAYCLWCALAWMCVPDRASASSAVQVMRRDRQVSVSTPYLRLECDLRSGLFNIEWSGHQGHAPALQGAFCAARLADGMSLTSADYAEHSSAESDVASIHDG